MVFLAKKLVSFDCTVTLKYSGELRFFDGFHDICTFWISNSIPTEIVNILEKVFPFEMISQDVNIQLQGAGILTTIEYIGTAFNGNIRSYTVSFICANEFRTVLCHDITTECIID